MEVYNYFKIRLANGYTAFCTAGNKYFQLLDSMANIPTGSDEDASISFYYNQADRVFISTLRKSVSCEHRLSSFIHIYAITEFDFNDDYSQKVNEVFNTAYNKSIVTEIADVYKNICQKDIADKYMIERELYKHNIDLKIIQKVFKCPTINEINTYNSPLEKTQNLTGSEKFASKLVKNQHKDKGSTNFFEIFKQAALKIAILIFTALVIIYCYNTFLKTPSSDLSNSKIVNKEFLSEKFDMSSIDEYYRKEVERLLLDWEPKYKYESSPPKELYEDTVCFNTDCLSLSVGRANFYYLYNSGKSSAGYLPLSIEQCTGELISFKDNKTVQTQTSEKGNIIFTNIEPGIYYYCVKASGYETRYSTPFKLIKGESQTEDVLSWSAPLTQINDSSYSEPFCIQLFNSDGVPFNNRKIYITNSSGESKSYTPFVTDGSGYVCFQSWTNGITLTNLCLFSSLTDVELLITDRSLNRIQSFVPKENVNNIIFVDEAT